MTYEYECKTCDFRLDITKYVKDLERSELCPRCLLPMGRLISAGHISMGNMDPHFNYAFGKVIRSKSDIKNEIARKEGETGVKLQEVGNDTMKSIKKKRKEYTIDL